MTLSYYHQRLSSVKNVPTQQGFTVCLLLFVHVYLQICSVNIFQSTCSFHKLPTSAPPTSPPSVNKYNLLPPRTSVLSPRSHSSTKSTLTTAAAAVGRGAGHRGTVWNSWSMRRTTARLGSGGGGREGGRGLCLLSAAWGSQPESPPHTHTHFTASDLSRWGTTVLSSRASELQLKHHFLLTDHMLWPHSASSFTSSPCSHFCTLISFNQDPQL